MKNYNYYGYNSQNEYDYYNRKSKQDSANIAAVCFALLFVMLLVAGIVSVVGSLW